MDSIKTYSTIQLNNASHEFKWEDMGQIYIQHQGQADSPHRHDYYTILFIEEAQGQHLLDFEAYELGSHQIYFIQPGQVHQLVEAAPPIGQVLVFSSDFLVHNNIPVSFIEDLHLFRSYGQHPPLELHPQQWTKIRAYLTDIQEAFESQKKYRMTAIGALLKLLLIYCHHHCILEEENLQQLEAGQSILKNFKQLVEQHYPTWHSSTQYAQALHITPDHLNRTIKSLLGKTAKAYLQERLTIAAKRLLYFSELSNKEIGYELGFSEPANFSAFFKRNTGVSPSYFRNIK